MQTNELNRSPARAALRNATLASLPEALFESLAPHLSHVDLPQGLRLIQADRDIQWVYFLESGMGSMTSIDFEGTPVEVGIIGREGLIGVQALLGQPQTRTTVVMQGAGEGYRIRADVLREQVVGNSDLLPPLHAFLYALLEQTTQLILCNRLHELESRLARWLLMASDFMETQSIRLTQEFLAEMLGVGRPAVTITAGILQRRGLIMYRRGLVEIIDRDRLREAACECYGIIRGAYQKVYPELY